MKGSCHCGRVRIEISDRPEYVNFCDCTLCAKSGGAWAYFKTDAVTVSGETCDYIRADYDDPVVVVHFCADCGSATHWTLVPGELGDIVGVNVRLFEPDELAGIEARFPDGRNWNGKGPADLRRAPGIIGQDAFI